MQALVGGVRRRARPLRSRTVKTSRCGMRRSLTSRRWPTCSSGPLWRRTAGPATRRGPTPPTTGSSGGVWESRLGTPRTWSGVATIGGAIAGTVHVRPWAGDDLDPASAAELNGAYVDPRAQGRGLGRLLERRGDRGGGVSRLRRPSPARHRAQHPRAALLGAPRLGPRRGRSRGERRGRDARAPLYLPRDPEQSRPVACIVTDDVSRYYLTTPIYYVNDAPHIGHAYTTVIGRRGRPLAPPARRRTSTS